MTSTAVPPRPNTMTGPKVGSSATPAINSRAFGRKTSGWMVTPVIRASGLTARAGKNIHDRVAHRALTGEVEPDAANFGLVNDIRRQDFRHHARSLRQERPRGGGGFIAIAGEPRGCDRNRIG